MGAILIPTGFTIWSTPRTYKNPLRKKIFGGMAIIYRNSLPLICRPDLCSPDIQVAQLGPCLIINSYLRPASAPSPYDEWASIEPAEAFGANIQLFATISSSLLIMGDLNGRTASVVPYEGHPVRQSMDTAETDPRGRSVLQTCRDHHLTLLNGLPGMGPSAASHTSFHVASTNRATASVIDYALVSPALYPQVLSLAVLPHDNQLSDHAALILHLSVKLELADDPQQISPSRMVLPHAIDLSQIPRNEADDAVKLILSQALDLPSLKRRLFGQAPLNDTGWKAVYLAACQILPLRARKFNCAVHWGPNSSTNCAWSCPASVTSAPSAILFAMRQVLTLTPQHWPLRFFSPLPDLLTLLDSDIGKAFNSGFSRPGDSLVNEICCLIQQRRGVISVVLADEDSEWAVGANSLCASCPTRQVPPLQVVNPCKLLPRSEELLPCKLTVASASAGAACPFPLTKIARTKLSTKEARRLNRKLLLDLPNTQSLWKLKKKWTSTRKVTNVIPVHSSAMAFDLRFNMPLPRSSNFNLPNLKLNASEAEQIGAQTADSSPLLSFSRPISVDEIDAMKQKLSAKTSSAPSEDDVSYKHILDIDSEELTTFVNEQFNSPFIPMDWRKATVVAIPKKGGASSDPSAQRMIVLESCLLKCLTMLLNTRVQEWAENAKILPPSQNGFRPGHRGNDNVFIFKTVVEKAKRLNTPLYAAFIDLSNAFPSVDRDTLWAKLHRLGMSGPMFDWLRRLYAAMSYSVRKGDEMSDRFSSDLGILQGDPPSPTLFLLFLLDLIFEDDPSDICLLDTLISHLEQADDLVIFATKAAALQKKLNTLAAWARDNAMTVNPTKSAILIFASTPPPSVIFYLGMEALPTKTEYCYLGFTITTAPRIGIMDLNYASLAARAGAAGVALFTMQAMAGTLRPAESLQLYHALIDPYITYGADFMIDAKKSLLKLFESTQHSFLRRVMCLHDYSIIVVLFSELGIWPIKWRRLDLALRYATYLISLPHERLAWKAWAESVKLHNSFIPGNHLKTQSGWTHDLSMAFPSAPLPASYSDWSLDTVSQLRKLLRYEMEQQIRASLPASRTPAISARIHASSAPLLKKRAYLDIVSQNHRIALTRLLCASHNLAVESLRHVRLDGSVRIAREERICRLCGAITGEVEDLHHVLFNCKGHLRLLTLRRDFFTQLPSLDRTCLPAPSDENAWNLRIIQWADDASSATALARLAWHVSRLFYSYDLPARSVDRLAVHDIVPATIMPPLDQDDGSDYGSADEAA